MIEQQHSDVPVRRRPQPRSGRATAHLQGIHSRIGPLERPGAVVDRCEGVAPLKSSADEIRGRARGAAPQKGMRVTTKAVQNSSPLLTRVV